MEFSKNLLSMGSAETMNGFSGIDGKTYLIKKKDNKYSKTLYEQRKKVRTEDLAQFSGAQQVVIIDEESYLLKQNNKVKKV